MYNNYIISLNSSTNITTKCHRRALWRHVSGRYKWMQIEPKTPDYQHGLCLLKIGEVRSGHFMLIYHTYFLYIKIFQNFENYVRNMRLGGLEIEVLSSKNSSPYGNLTKEKVEENKKKIRNSYVAQNCRKIIIHRVAYQLYHFAYSRQV